MDLANLGVAAAVFGQLVGGKGLNWPTILWTAFVAVLLYGLGYSLMKGKP